MRCAQAALRVAMLLAVSLFFTSPGQAACRDEEHVTLLPVARDVWRVPAARGQPDEANRGVTIQLVLVRDGTRVWLVGSGPTPAFGAALACAARRITGQAVTDVVNTHVAPELSLGNSAFPGARLWALPQVIAAMQERCGQCLARLKDQIGPAGRSLVNEAIRVPTGLVQPGRLGPFDALALDRQPGEPALVLRHRRSKIVIAQGLLWADAVPDLYGTTSEALLQSLGALERFATGARLIGEQGDVVGPAALAAQRSYVEALRQAVRQRLASGDVQGDVPLPAYAELPGYATQHPLNVQRVWRELEPELFR